MRRPHLFGWVGRYFRWKKSLPWPKRWAMWAVTVIVSFLASYVTVDTTSRLFMSDEPTPLVYQGTGPKGSLIIYIGGAGSSPKAQSAGMLPMLLAKAERVVIVENATHLFGIVAVIALVRRLIKGYVHVTFVVGSMGGLVAYDVIVTERAAGNMQFFGVVMVDSPADGSDVIGITDVQKELFRYPAGVLTNQFVHTPFDRHAPAIIDPDTNRELLETLWRSLETWLASAGRDQARYVFAHPAPAKLDNVALYFVRSGADKFVNGVAAAPKWRVVDPSMPEPTVVPGGEHMAFLNRTTLYNKAIATGIDNVRSRADVALAG